jgi:hypothetical protein
MALFTLAAIFRRHLCDAVRFRRVRDNLLHQLILGGGGEHGLAPRHDVATRNALFPVQLRSRPVHPASCVEMLAGAQV